MYVSGKSISDIIGKNKSKLYQLVSKAMTVENNSHGLLLVEPPRHYKTKKDRLSQQIKKGKRGYLDNCVQLQNILKRIEPKRINEGILLAFTVPTISDSIS